MNESLAEVAQVLVNRLFDRVFSMERAVIAAHSALLEHSILNCETIRS